MKMMLHDNYILQQLRREIDNGHIIDNIKIKEAGMMECCQTDNIKYHLSGRIGISPENITNFAMLLTTPVTCVALMEIYYESGYLDSILFRSQEISDIKWNVESYFDTNDKPRHVHSSLNVKKIIFTRLVKSNQYPDIVVPHKTIVRVVE